MFAREKLAEKIGLPEARIQVSVTVNLTFLYDNYKFTEYHMNCVHYWTKVYVALRCAIICYRQKRQKLSLHYDLFRPMFRMTKQIK